MTEYIKVDLIHNLYKNKVWKEIKLNKYDTIENIKKKIYVHTGTPYDDMKLYAYDELNIEQTQVFLGDNNLCLHDYNVKDNYIIYVYEQKQSLGDIYNIDDEYVLEQLKDRKYKISEEAYAKRQDSMRNFLKKIREQKKKETTEQQYSEANNDTNCTDKSKVTYDTELYKIGNRCRVLIGDRRGVLKFIGHLKNKKEVYVGIDLDEPLGNSDGFYQKDLLFECKGEKYGYLGLLSSIEMGDFPPTDIFNMEEL